MILFTQIEIMSSPKKSEEDYDEEDYDELTKKVLRESGIYSEEKEDEEEDKKWEKHKVEAILDLVDDLLFYEYKDFTYVEKLTPSSVVKITDSLDHIKSLYIEKYDPAPEDEEDILTQD